MNRDSIINLIIKVLVVAIILTLIIIIFNFLFNNSNNKDNYNNNNNEIIEQDIIVSTTNISINVGETFQVNAQVIPNNSTYKKLLWTSINPYVASVSDNGLITGLNPGKCMIQVATEKKGIFKVISVTVNSIIIDVNKIIINNPNIEIFIDDVVKINYEIEPSNATNKDIILKSDNPNIVSINDNNTIVGLMEGDTTITLTSNNGISEKVNIKVKKKTINVSKVILNKLYAILDIGNTDTLVATVEPSNASDTSITWKSSNTKVVNVINGKLYAISEGTAIITALSSNGIEASCPVMVVKPTPIETYEKPITETSTFRNFGNIAACNSDSLKYRIINYNGNDWALIWIKNPSIQLNNAIVNGKASAEEILNNEINNYGYQNKCLVAANASFFNMSSGNVLSNIVINRGRIIKNTGYASCLGVTKNGKLKEYVNQPISSLINDGVMSTFGHSNSLSPRNYKDVDKTNRTVICQVNKNNFILVSGNGVPEKIAYDVNRMTGGASCFNLDGGGSRKLYYKTQNSPIIKRFGGSRKIPDMIYFVEQ